jgi:hypothetical protein
MAGMGGGKTMAGSMLGSMYGGGGGGFGSAVGRGGGGRGGTSFEGNYFSGAPMKTPDSIYRLQEQCSRGDGHACIQLQIAQQRFAEEQSQYNWEQQQNSWQARNRYRPMSMGGGW